MVTNNSTPENLSAAGLTGIGALVGLFSKEAIEKLRELFNTLFSTRKNVEESVEKSLLERMPPELREEVRHYLGVARNPSAGNTNAANTNTPDGIRQAGSPEQ